VVLIKGQEPMFAVVSNVTYETYKALDQLSVRIVDFINTGCAQVNFEFQVVERMRPTAHLWVDKCAGVARADAGDMRVMIDQPFRIDVFERARNQVGSF